MKIVKLRLSNFMSFGEDNEIDLKDRGLLLVEGDNQAAGSASSNGAGKTSLVEAVPFAFFGETTKGVLADEVVNKQAGKDCIVSVILEGDAGKLFEVVRTRKHSKHNNSLMLRQIDADGNVLEDLAGIDTAATQERINNLLMTYPVFMNSAYFAQESLKPFCEMTDKQIKDVFMKALSLERFTGSLESVRADINSELKELDRVLAGIDSVTNEILGSENRLNDLVKRHEGFLSDQALAVSELKLDIEREEGYLGAVVKKGQELEIAQEKYGELKAMLGVYDEIQKATTEISNLKASIEASQKYHEDFMAKKKSDLAKVNADIKAQQESLARLEGREKELVAYVSKIDSLNAILVGSEEVVKMLGDVQNQISEYTKIRAQIEYQIGLYRETLEKTARDSADVESKVGAACPECGRIIVESCFASILEANKNKLDECSEKIEEFNGLLQASWNAVEVFTKQKQALEAKESVYRETRETIMRLSGSVQAMKAEIAGKERVLDAIDALMARKGEIENEPSRFLDVIKQDSLRLEALTKDVSSLMKKLADTKSASKYFSGDEALQLARLENAVADQIAELLKEISEKPAIKARLDGDKKALADKEKEISPYLLLIQKEKAELKNLADILAGMEKGKATKEDRLEYLRFLEVAFGYSGLPSFMLDSVTPYLNERASHYSSIICDGEIRVEFCTTSRTKKGAVKDKFNISVSHSHGGDRYRSVSGGEKRRADLIIAQSMQDLVRSFGQNRLEIGIFDEPFAAGLDAEGIEGVLNLLEEVSSGGRTVLLVSHLPEIKSICKSVVTVRKDKSGISRIEM